LARVANDPQRISSVPCLVAPSWWVLDFLRGAASAPTRSGREIIIPAGSLRDDSGVSPEIDACWQSRARWLSDVVDLPTED
jgi:hypothetical protein